MKKLIIPAFFLFAPLSQAYVLAPAQPPVAGTKNLACIGIKYQDTAKFTSAGEATSMCHQISDFYQRNSRGVMQLKPAGYQQNVSLDGVPKNVNQAVNIAKAAHPQADFYAIVEMFISASHSGGGVSNLITSLASTATHEVGHLLGLGHAGTYKLVNGTWTLDAYGDGQSVMSRYPSAWLTAPQYYHQGWMPQAEAAIYTADQTYSLKRINDFTGQGLSTVIVDANLFQPNGMAAPLGDVQAGKRDAYISFPTGCGGICMAIHLSANDGGSQKVRTFTKEYYDERFTGLHVKLLDQTPSQITISVDFAKKPVGTVDEPDINSTGN